MGLYGLNHGIEYSHTFIRGCCLSKVSCVAWRDVILWGDSLMNADSEPCIWMLHTWLVACLVTYIHYNKRLKLYSITMHIVATEYTMWFFTHIGRIEAIIYYSIDSYTLEIDVI